MDQIHGEKLFSKINLCSSYHKIKMHEDDIYKRTLWCHYGHFEFLVMPFGLTNAPYTFQYCMKKVFGKQLHNFFLVFFDDIFIYCKSWDEHMHHLDILLTTLED